MNSVLIIEDEKDICDAVRYALEKEGCKVHSSNDGIKGLFLAAKVLPDLVILDLMLPGMNGMDICRKLKADPKTAGIPVVILSAKSSETDKIGCFELGADDYVTKPFSIGELIARLKAVSKRNSDPGRKNRYFRKGNMEIDPSGRSVTLNGREIDLSLKEYDLLHYLALNEGKALTRKEILKDVWNIQAEIDTRTVDVHVTRIRNKLRRSSCRIESVHGIGYKFSIG